MLPLSGFNRPQINDSKVEDHLKSLGFHKRLTTNLQGELVISKISGLTNAQTYSFIIKSYNGLTTNPINSTYLRQSGPSCKTEIKNYRSKILAKNFFLKNLQL